MLHTDDAPATPNADEREARILQVIAQLRPHTEHAVRQMAERLVDLPEDKSFGAIEYDLRDLAHELASASHQAGLQAGKKRATKAPVSSAPTATATPASSTTDPKPG